MEMFFLSYISDCVFTLDSFFKSVPLKTQNK